MVAAGTQVVDGGRWQEVAGFGIRSEERTGFADGMTGRQEREDL